MQITPVKTSKILPGQATVNSILDEYILPINEDSVVAITSKIVSLCQGRVIPAGKLSKDELSKQESNLYYPASQSKYNHHFTIVYDTIIGMAGIDESNGNGAYILLPEDPQTTANEIRGYLSQKFSLSNLGAIITDSISIPLRLGAVGACLAYSGFKPVKDYRGQDDLFGRPFKISQANIAAGLAAAAVLAMGEGAEQTPIAIIEDIPGIEFCQNDPSAQELKEVNLTLQDDLFAPFLDNGQWQKGDRTP